jgi:hypothetical protein
MLLKFTHPVHLDTLLDSSMRQTWFVSQRAFPEKFPCLARPLRQTQMQMFFCTLTIFSVLRAMSRYRWENATLGLAMAI